MEKLLFEAINAALRAGDEIMKIYQSDFSVEMKLDKSPLTQADLNAHTKITELLSKFNIPILSEENKDNEITYALRSKWNKLWIVDPLDGTKEFVKRNGEFTVNISEPFNVVFGNSFRTNFDKPIFDRESPSLFNL